MPDKLKKIQTLLKWLCGFHILLSLGAAIFLIFFAGELVIGMGKFQSFITRIESVNFKLWLFGATLLYFFASLSFFIASFVVDASAWQMDQIRDFFYRFLKDKIIPVKVDIDEVIPVTMPGPVNAPFSVQTVLNFKETVHIDTIIPVKTSLPVDAVIETKILGVGSVKIPIKTTIPVDIDFPFKGDVTMSIQGMNFKLQENALVSLPTLNIPIKCHVEARLDLEKNLQLLEKLISKKV